MDIMVHILFISDIIGPHGMDIVASVLPKLKQERQVDLVIANGENVTQGRGLDDKSVRSLKEMQIDVITSGNHIWQRRKYLRQLESNSTLLRPLNYPSECPGHGSCVIETNKNIKVGVINIQGRSFMYPIDCPFISAINEVQAMKKDDVNCIIIDFHAEATAEKVALGWYLDGKVSAVVGTHTHIQTADERILPNGTAYITDTGMTGPYHSVIGMNINAAIQRFLTQMPIHYTAAPAIDLKFCGLYISIDSATGRAKALERLQIDV